MIPMIQFYTRFLTQKSQMTFMRAIMYDTAKGRTGQLSVRCHAPPNRAWGKIQSMSHFSAEKVHIQCTRVQRRVAVLMQISSGIAVVIGQLQDSQHQFQLDLSSRLANQYGELAPSVSREVLSRQLRLEDHTLRQYVSPLIYCVDH